MQGRLHLRVRAREPEAHIESRVEIDRAWATAQQAVEVGAAKGGAGRWWLERAVREVVRGEVERLEGEHVVHETVEIGWSAASNVLHLSRLDCCRVAVSGGANSNH